MNITLLLQEARELIETPDRWTQGQSRVLRNGEWCYCAWGAIVHVADSLDARRMARLIEILVSPYRGYPAPEAAVICWNDATGRTHAEVLEVFDQAIIESQKETA